MKAKEEKKHEGKIILPPGVSLFSFFLFFFFFFYFYMSLNTSRIYYLKGINNIILQGEYFLHYTRLKLLLFRVQ